MRFQTWEVEVLKQEYNNGGIALTLVGFDTEPYDPDETFYIGDVLCATVWVEGLLSGEIAVKNYGENQGILDWLLENNFIDTPVNLLDGFYVFKLRDDAPVVEEDDVNDAYKRLQSVAKDLGFIPAQVK